MPIDLFEEGQTNSGWYKLQSYKKYKGKGEVYMDVTYTTQNKVILKMSCFNNRNN